MNEPSWTTVEGATVPTGAEVGEGDGLRKVDKESLDKGRGARSPPTWVSCRGTGTGEVGRLDGRKSDVGLRAYIV